MCELMYGTRLYRVLCDDCYTKVAYWGAFLIWISDLNDVRHKNSKYPIRVFGQKHFFHYERRNSVDNSLNKQNDRTMFVRS